MPIPWNDVANSVMLAEMNKPTVRVMKTSSFFHTDTKSRGATIDSNEFWKEFSKDAYLPWYHPGGEWSDPANINWTLPEQAKQSPLSFEQTDDLLVVSGYHELLGKRVIIDGCHRAVATETAVQKGAPIPPVKVLECYGTQIHAILFADFCNLVAKALKSK